MGMRSILGFLFSLSLFFMWWTYSSIRYENKEQNLTQQLHVNVTQSYLEEHILTSIHEEHFDDVLMYQDLATLLGMPLSAATLAQIEAHNGMVETSWRNVKAFTSGFLSGESDSTVGLSGSITSDLTLYGDIRDLKQEGTKYIDDEPYDAFILNISLVGIGLSASQLLSAGAATPLKIGASVLKAAKKTGKLTKPFAKILSTKLSKTVDTKILKSLDFNSLFRLGDTTKTIARSIDMKPVTSLFNEVNLIKTNTSLTDTIGLMKYVDTHKELKTIGKISSTYKTNTKGVMQVLGKGALRAGKSVVKFTTKLIYQLMGLALSVVGFFLMLLLKWRGMKQIRSIVS